MKIITLVKAIKSEDLLNYFIQHVNEAFHQRRHTDISFSFEVIDNEIQILNRQLYEDALFRIRVNGKEIDIKPSEHYTDDINAITLEDILFTLISNYPGNEIELITTRS